MPACSASSNRFASGHSHRPIAGSCCLKMRAIALPASVSRSSAWNPAPRSTSAHRLDPLKPRSTLMKFQIEGQKLRVRIDEEELARLLAGEALKTRTGFADAF